MMESSPQTSSSHLPSTDSTQESPLKDAQGRPPLYTLKGKDVVVSGVSCRLPESDNLEEFWQNLENSVDMVTEDDRRWQPGLHGLPLRNGKLKSLSQFDAEFFHINPPQANAMDPQLRILLEVTYEAIVDAGYNPRELKGANACVYVGSMFAEGLDSSSGSVEANRRLGYGLTGGCDTMFANYLSFCFDFKGPSMSINTGCSASLSALDLALQNIHSGQCDYAIVAGTNVITRPGTSLHFHKLKMISDEGTCKAFDEAASGYVRSEGVVALFLTTREKSRRNYLRILNCKSACDGHKPEGLTYPSSEAQRNLILSTYREIDLEPASVFYIEAHGTGTQAGDYEECKALDEVLCSAGNTELGLEHSADYATPPLLIGSVKSNMGHCEPTSGLAGIVKIILSFQHGVIPPNIHYMTPNPKILGITEGRLKVVTNPTAIPPDAIVGVNSFGFGGAISHVVLQGEIDKDKKEDKIDPSSTLSFPVSSRTQEGLKHLMEEVENHIESKDTLKILNSLNERSHPYRGYILWNDSEILEKSDLELEVPPDHNSSSERPVWFVFDGMGSQWIGMGKHLLQYPLFVDTIQRCYKSLPSNVHDIITDPAVTNDETHDKNLYPELDQVAALCATTIGLCELLKAAGIVPDNLIGHSLGELLLCYVDGTLTLEQVMQTAYWRVKCMNETPGIQDGAMAAVGLTWEQAMERCPEGVWPACYNALDNVTISGRKGSVESFVAQLGKEGIFAKLVNSFGHAIHSPLLKPVVNDRLLAILRNIISKPKQQSHKWIVSSHFLEENQSDKVYSSAVFHVNSLIYPVNFYHTLQQIPSNAIVIEVGPHALLQVILKRTLGSDVTIVPLQNWKESDQSVVFMRALARCHIAGLTVDPLALLGPLKLPVSVKTPSISHLMSWDHLDEWFVAKPEDFAHNYSQISESIDGLQQPSSHLPLATSTIVLDSHILSLELKDDSLSLNLRNYQIHDVMTIPPSFYLLLAWHTLAVFYNTSFTMFPVVFKDITFYETIQLDETLHSLETFISTVSGHFEVMYRSINHSKKTKLISSGKIAVLTAEVLGLQAKDSSTPELSLDRKDLYKELSVKGCRLKEEFQLLSKADLQITECEVKLEHPLPMHTACYMQLEALFQMGYLSSDELTLPKTISRLEMNPRKMELSSKEMQTSFSYVDGCYFAKGLSMTDMKLEQASSQIRRKVDKFQPLIENFSFEPYFQSTMEDRDHSYEQLRSLMDIVRENTFRSSVSILQIVTGMESDENLKLISQIRDVTKSCPWVEFIHDVLAIGQDFETSLGISGKMYYVDSLSDSLPSDLPLYDLIILSDTSAVSPVLSVASPELLGLLNHGGFILLQELIPASVEKGSFEGAGLDISNELERFDIHCMAQKHCISPSTGAIKVLQLFHDSQGMNFDSEASFAFVKVENEQLSWVKELKTLLKDEQGPKRIYCISEFDSTISPSGLVGMGKCLKLEPLEKFNVDRVRLLYLFDRQWSADFKDSFTWKQIVKADLFVNIIKDEEFGSFRHLSLELEKSDLNSAVKQPSKDESSNADILKSASTAQKQTDKLQLSSESLTSMYKSSSQNTDVEKFTCDPEKAYIITGGLGGCGLELATWLISRGARQLYLTSRSGVQSGYQARKIETMKKKGVEVCVSNLDVSKYPQALSLIDAALQGSPRGIGGVFHLAAVLRDSLFRNQTAKRFESVLQPKSTGALNLDKALRKISIDSLTLFVAFSSVASGHGNMGQSSYGFANSLMDRLCEQRCKDGLHGLSIQWGAIGGVGMVNKLGTEVESIGGTRLQPISSCLASLDVILASHFPVVSCYVPNTKYSNEVDSAVIVTSEQKIKPKAQFSAGEDNKVDVIISREDDFKSKLGKILSIRSKEKLRMHSTLTQLGLDSLMSFELRQLLEKDYSVFVSTNDLPNKKVQELVIEVLKDSQAVATEIETRDADQSASLEDSFTTKFCKILSIRNKKKLRMNPTLAQLALDSLMSFELRQLLEKDYTLLISTSDLPQMKVQELIENVREVSSKQSAMEYTPQFIPAAGTAEYDALSRQASDVSVSTVSTVNSQSDLVTVQGRSDE